MPSILFDSVFARPHNAICLGLRYRWILLVLVAGAFVDAAAAETTYWRVTMDRVTVVANGSSDRCSRLATQLTTFERLLTELAGWNADFQLPPIALYSLSPHKQDRSSAC